MNWSFESVRQYVTTTEYFHGVIVAVTGVLIEVILVLMLIPVFVRWLEDKRTEPWRIMSLFYLFQVFHSCCNIFLNLVGITDVPGEILKKMFREPKSDVVASSHTFYANLENKLFLLKEKVAGGVALESHLTTKGAKDIQEFVTTLNGCLTEIDRIVMMPSSSTRLAGEYPGIRFSIFALRDLFSEVQWCLEKKAEALSTKAYEIKKAFPLYVELMDVIFTRERKFIDRRLRERIKHEQRVEVFKLCISAAKEIPGRLLGRLRENRRRAN